MLSALADRHKDEAKEWLRGEKTYTLHRPAISKFVRRPTVVAGIGEQVQADLVDVTRLNRANGGVKFLLTCIDVFSKRAWVFPLPNKKGSEVAEKVEALLNDAKFRTMQTDKGKEFYNADVKRVLAAHGTTHFSTENNTIKAAVVERFNRTLRDRIYHHMTYKGTQEYVSVLPDIVVGYNDSYHETIGMSPNEVTRENQEEIWDRLNAGAHKRQWDAIKPRLEVGDTVRLSKARRVFTRGYTPNWTTEVFRVSEVLSKHRPVVYRIRDLADEVIEGTFYERELQKVTPTDVYAVERVLRRRNGGRQLLVRWEGYPPSFDSWINREDYDV